MLCLLFFTSSEPPISKPFFHPAFTLYRDTLLPTPYTLLNRDTNPQAWDFDIYISLEGIKSSQYLSNLVQLLTRRVTILSGLAVPPIPNVLLQAQAFALPISEQEHFGCKHRIAPVPASQPAEIKPNVGEGQETSIKTACPRGVLNDDAVVLQRDRQTAADNRVLPHCHSPSTPPWNSPLPWIPPVCSFRAKLSSTHIFISASGPPCCHHGDSRHQLKIQWNLYQASIFPSRGDQFAENWLLC